MNPKIRALIWEELRTGGVIACWCVLVAALCLASARLTEGWDFHWGFARPVALTLSLLPLLLLAFLLLYRTGNSGNLTGGFSGRILLLPVETWKLSGLMLILRAALLGCATLAICGVCRAAFAGNGPAWVFALLLPGAYLALQALDWLRRPNPLLSILGLLPVLAAIVVLIESESVLDKSLDNEIVSGKAGITFLIASALFACVIALYAVDRTRRGARTQLMLRVGLPEVVRLPGWRIERGFRSPRWALLWHFLCRDGFVLPLFALILSAIVMLGYGALLKFLGEDAPSLAVLLDWGVWPLFALSAMVWGGLRGGAGLQRGVRPVLTEYLYPLSAAEMAVTRLWGYGVALGVTWAIALAVSNLGFFVGDEGLAWRIWMASIAAGESSLRELLASRLQLAIVLLIGVWVLMAIRTRLVAWMLGLAVLYSTTALVFHTYYRDADRVLLLLLPLTISLAGTLALMAWTRRGFGKSWPVAALWALPYALAVCLGMSIRKPNDIAWFAVALSVLITLAAIVWSWRRGVMPLRHVLGCGVAWVLTMLFAYPFGEWPLSGTDRQSLLIVCMFGALVVLPYPALLLDLHRKRHHDDTPIQEAEHAVRTSWGLPSNVTRAVFAFLAVSLLGAVWLRWPAEPAYIETLRAQGKPATAVDLALMYPPLPAEDNAALHYLEVVREKRLRGKDWYGWVQARRDELDEGEADQVYDRNGPLIDGAVGLKPGERLWAKQWPVALAYHDKVSAPTAMALAEIARAGYPHSRYPLDFGSGVSVGLHHLSPIRDLARAQNFEVWMAAMEDRPQDAIDVIEMMGPLAESLREEPLLISQLVRIAMHGIMNAAVEQALNRTAFSEEQLEELQRYLATLLPPISEHSMIAQGLIGERAFSSKLTPGDLAFDNGMNLGLHTYQESYFTFSRIVIQRCYEEMEANTANRRTRFVEELEDTDNPNYILPKILMPALDRAREAEWRCRVSLDMAATACAVERYRLKHGALPESLNALLPAFMESVPADPFRDDGGPVSYRVTEDGGYLLYSWAMNRTDENGVHQDRTEKKGSDWSNGDWIFSVAPLSFRNGPQLTDTPPTDDKDEVTPPAGTRRGRSLQAG